MMYIGRAFRKIGERINQLLHRHEPLEDYRVEEPGYVPPVQTSRVTKPEVDLPGFDPHAGKYKVRIGYRKNEGKGIRKVGLVPGKAKNKKKREEEEYREPKIIELKKVEKEKGKAA